MAAGYKTGGRKKGTPNKANPLKSLLKNHSAEYFNPKPQVDDKGNPKTVLIRDRDGDVISEVKLADRKGKPLVISDFDVDMMQLECRDRVNAELRLLEFHTAKMKAVEVDLEANVTASAFEEILSSLCQ